MKIAQKISGLVLAGLIAAGAMAAAPAPAADRVIKVGTLKLIHAITPYFYEKFTPAGYKIEVIPYETPTDGKNAVVTRSVDFGTYGLAAATLGGAAGEPVVIIGAQCNRGMAVVAGAKSDIKSIKDLAGKKVAILPGSTQEVVILDRLKMEGMSIKDIQPIRVSFSDMPAALERGASRPRVFIPSVRCADAPAASGSVGLATKEAEPWPSGRFS